METYKNLRNITKRLDDVQRKAEKASQARFNSPHGTSRAKTTTLNARWGVYAESRQLVFNELIAELSALGIEL